MCIRDSPGRCARITVTPKPEAEFHDGEQEELGIMGEIHPDVAENYGMDGLRIYCCELMFDGIMRHADTEIVYTPLPKYPSTSRDIALLVDEEMEVGKIETIIRENGGQILESVKLFDVYRGKQVDEGKLSLIHIFREDRAVPESFPAEKTSLMDRELFEKLSGTETSQGVIATADKNITDISSFARCV